LYHGIAYFPNFSAAEKVRDELKGKYPEVRVVGYPRGWAEVAEQRWKNLLHGQRDHTDLSNKGKAWTFSGVIERGGLILVSD
jgi:hypothetical protein